MKPYYQDEWVTIYHGDCREILPELPKVDLVLTDPPYPNNANHFNDGVVVAKDVLWNIEVGNTMVFWNELEHPPVNNTLVAVHIWYRNNSNRPDNYEPIYEFCVDGGKRASRVLSYPVIAVGLTGCIEATGHPTQKNQKLILQLIQLSRTKGIILDPFLGSGTTCYCAKKLNRKSIGIEIEEKYCEIAARRCSQSVMELNI